LTNRLKKGRKQLNIAKIKDISMLKHVTIRDILNKNIDKLNEYSYTIQYKCDIYEKFNSMFKISINKKICDNITKHIKNY
jgi:hypothetical protein